MKFSDPKIVEQKARSMMKRQVELLSRCYGSFQEQGGQYCHSFKNGETLWVAYEQDKKLVSKVFSTKLTLNIPTTLATPSWKAKLSFFGHCKINGIVWKTDGKGSAGQGDVLNEKSQLNKALFQAAKEIDLVTIKAEYSASAQLLKVQIFPYAGSFIWIKIPPVYYDVPLKSREIAALEKITAVFSKTFKCDKKG